MHLKIGSRADQLFSHAQKGRDANAPGQQHMALRIRRQRKVVARRADLQRVALVHQVVHGLRAAARMGVAQDSHLVTVGFARRVAQGILPHQAPGQMHVHMRAGGERGQGGAIGSDQLETVNIERFALLARHAHAQGRGVVHVALDSSAT